MKRSKQRIEPSARTTALPGRTPHLKKLGSPARNSVTNSASAYTGAGVSSARPMRSGVPRNSFSHWSLAPSRTTF